MATSPFFVKSKLKVKNTSADTYAATIENGAFNGDKTFVLPVITAASANIAQTAESQTFAGAQVFSTSISSPSHIISSFGGGATTLSRPSSAADYTLSTQNRNGYVADLQNIQDAAVDKPSYQFTTGQQIVTGTAASIELGASDATIIVTAMNTGGTPSATDRMIARFSGTSSEFGIYQKASTNLLRISNNAGAIDSVFAVTPFMPFTVAAKRYGGNKAQMFVNGIAGTADQTYTFDTLATTIAKIGNTTSTYGWVGSISRALFFNYALTADKIARYSAGAKLDWEDVGGSMTQQTSGTLVIGKRYRTVDWITDDDFTNVSSTGASANVDGAEWTCIATTPAKWTNASKLIPLGCVLDLEPEGIAAGKWKDSSTNNLDGTVTGAVATDVQNQWTAYTATLANAGAGATQAFRYRVINNSIEIAGTIVLGTTTTGSVTWQLPTGYFANFTSQPLGFLATNAYQVVGNCSAYKVDNSKMALGWVNRDSTSTTTFYGVVDAGAAFGVPVGLGWGMSNCGLATGDTISVSMTVPL